ncbi:MAG: hypothetical protein M3252_01435, partial [Actinomycetota bacterium]|nr:hypothetical protein [Actinomycetota bacterium]
MTMSKGGRLVLAALLVGVLAGLAALVQPANAGSTAPVATASEVAGTVSTRMVLNRFTAVGRRVVGRGTVTSTFRDATGKTTVSRKRFWIRIREQSARFQQATMCHILFLEIGEVDLTLAGLHAVLRSANPGEPVQLRLQARREGGILGRLFCDLTQGGGALATPQKATRAAKLLNARVRKAMVMQVRAVIYRPSGSGAVVSPQAALLGQQQQAECPVLHLVLGPVHLDLLGL